MGTEDDERWGLAHYHTLTVLFAAYAIGMYAKGAMSLGIFGMSKDTALGYSATDVSSLLAMGSAGYSAGKLVGGPISDFLGGKGTLASMLAIMAAAKLVMARSSGLGLMTTAWVAARVAHALTWPGVMLMIRPWFLGKTRTTALSILTTSSRVGAFLGSLIGGTLLSRAAGWRGLSRSTGIVTLAVAALQLTMGSGPRSTRSAPSTATAAPVAAAKAQVNTDKPVSPGGSTLSIVLRETKLFCVFGSTALVTPTFDLTTLLPMYLDSLGMNEVAIGQLGSLFPLAAVPAILIAGNLHQRISAKARCVMYPGMLCISAAGLAVLSSLTTASSIIAPTLIAIMAGVAPEMPMNALHLATLPLSLLLRTILQTLYVPNYDFILRFGGPLTGTLTGFCDLFGNVLTTVIYSIYPAMLARGGWPLVFRFYALTNLAAAACIGTFSVLEARNPLLRSPLEAREREE